MLRYVRARHMRNASKNPTVWLTNKLSLSSTWITLALLTQEAQYILTTHLVHHVTQECTDSMKHAIMQLYDNTRDYCTVYVFWTSKQTYCTSQTYRKLVNPCKPSACIDASVTNPTYSSRLSEVKWIITLKFCTEASMTWDSSIVWDSTVVVSKLYCIIWSMTWTLI